MTTRLSRSCCSALRSIRRSKNVSERCIKKIALKTTRTAASFDTKRPSQSDPSRPATRLPVARGLALFLHTFCLRNLSIGFRGPFRGLCLCRPKSRFPRAEIGVGGDLVRMLGQWEKFWNIWERPSSCDGETAGRHFCRGTKRQRGKSLDRDEQRVVNVRFAPESGHSAAAI
jgi:hypothetical protein